MTIATTTIEAGALVRGSIREALRAAKWNGYNFEFHEQKGLFESVFHIRGEKDDLERLINKFKRFM